eukprot:scaffold6488_cov250-Isochrysis_galbana.AAC.4
MTSGREWRGAVCIAHAERSGQPSNRLARASRERTAADGRMSAVDDVGVRGYLEEPTAQHQRRTPEAQLVRAVAEGLQETLEALALALGLVPKQVERLSSEHVVPLVEASRALALAALRTERHLAVQECVEHWLHQCVQRAAKPSLPECEPDSVLVALGNSRTPRAPERRLQRYKSCSNRVVSCWERHGSTSVTRRDEVGCLVCQQRRVHCNRRENARRRHVERRKDVVENALSLGRSYK